MRTDEELMTKLTVAVDRLADNAELVAVGIAKFTERCFCGDRLDEHPENGPCTNGDCEMGGKCEFFLPVHLAIARTMNICATELGAIRRFFAGAVPQEGPAPGGIVRLH